MITVHGALPVIFLLTAEASHANLSRPPLGLGPGRSGWGSLVLLGAAGPGGLLGEAPSGHQRGGEFWASLIAQLVKNPPAMQETPV